VSTELLLQQTVTEKEVFSLIGAGSRQISSRMRQFALHVINDLAKDEGLLEDVWFQGAVLLDAWLSAHPACTDSSFLGQMPAVISAVMRSLHKAYSTQAQGQQNILWRSHLENQVQLCMQMRGYAVPGGWHRDLRAQDQSLLRCVGWRINVPSLESWLSMLEKRFGVLTAEFFAEQVAWAKNMVRHLARLLVGSRPACDQRRPSRFARGLFALGLVHARLLPLEGLRPQHVDQDEWEQLFQESQAMGNVPPCALPQCLWQEQVLQPLIVSAHASLQEVQQACEFTMGCLRGALGDMHRELGLAAAP